MLDSFHGFSILPQVNSCDWSEPANTGTGCRVIRIQSPSTSKSRLQLSVAPLTLFTSKTLGKIYPHKKDDWQTIKFIDVFL